MKFFVKFDVEFDLKFEISDGKNLVKFGGGLFYLPRKHGKFQREFGANFGGNFPRKISETSFQISRLFFGSFVQWKGSAKPLTLPGKTNLARQK